MVMQLLGCLALSSLLLTRSYAWQRVSRQLIFLPRAQAACCVQRTKIETQTQTELQWEGKPADCAHTELKRACHDTLKQASQQTPAVEPCSKDTQTDLALQESVLTQTCLSAVTQTCLSGVTQQTQTAPCKVLQMSQLSQTPVLLLQPASTQTEWYQACKAQQTQTGQLKQEAASTQTAKSLLEAASTQTDYELQQASQCTQTPMLLQQPGSTQTEHIASQESQRTQTPLMLLHTASAQAVVETAEAASQSSTQAEQSNAAVQQIEALHGEVMGLQLKVQSVQGIIDIQGQQLKDAAGQSSNADDQVGFHLLFTSRHFDVARQIT